MRFLVLQIDKRNNEEVAIATRLDWNSAIEGVEEIRNAWPLRLKRRFAHEVRIMRDAEGGDKK